MAAVCLRTKNMLNVAELEMTSIPDNLGHRQYFTQDFEENAGMTTNGSDLLIETDGSESDWDSLFDEPIIPMPRESEATGETLNGKARIVASRSAIPIPGLYFDPKVLLPIELVESLWRNCMSAYFSGKNSNINQVMLFERAGVDSQTTSSALPRFLQTLLETLDVTLRPILPLHIHNLLFPKKSNQKQARQAILNLYRPGEGISPHVDLTGRFGDGIIGVSLHSGCVMRFSRGNKEEHSEEIHDIHLPPRSILVLTGEARYGWTHGIEFTSYDLVRAKEGPEVVRLERGTRLSITFRWLLPGAEIVGETE